MTADTCARCGASKDRHAMPRLTGACGQFVPDLLTDNAVAALAAPTTESVDPTVFGAYDGSNWPASIGPTTHDGKGFSEEKCVRGGWVMGGPALNCQNDNTPHRFPSQDDALAAERSLREAAEESRDVWKSYHGDACRNWDSTVIDRDAARADLATAQTEVEQVRESLGGMVEWLAEVICDAREALVAERLRYVGDLRGSRPPGKVPIDMQAVLAILDRERNANPSRYDTEKVRREAAEGEATASRETVARVRALPALTLQRITPHDRIANAWDEGAQMQRDATIRALDSAPSGEATGG